MKYKFLILLLAIVSQNTIVIITVRPNPALKDAVFAKNAPAQTEFTFTLPSQFKQLAAAVDHNLYLNIIPFWLNQSEDTIHGGFYGMVDNERNGNPEANKGLILNARIGKTASFKTEKSYNFIIINK